MRLLVALLSAGCAAGTAAAPVSGLARGDWVLSRSKDEPIVVPRDEAPSPPTMGGFAMSQELLTASQPLRMRVRSAFTYYLHEGEVTRIEVDGAAVRAYWTIDRARPIHGAQGVREEVRSELFLIGLEPGAARLRLETAGGPKVIEIVVDLAADAWRAVQTH